MLHWTGTRRTVEREHLREKTNRVCDARSIGTGTGCGYKKHRLYIAASSSRTPTGRGITRGGTVGDGLSDGGG